MDLDQENGTVAPMLADLGGELAAELGDDLDGVLLYVEAGPGWMSPSLWRGEGDSVRYYDTPLAIKDLVWDIWEVPSPERRWSKMFYVVTGTQFRTEFKYPDNESVDIANALDRREAVLNHYFPGKIVVYPPSPGAEE